MARQPRITIPAFPHHVIQRGNNRQPIFFTNADYRFFLDCLLKEKSKYRSLIYAYVLMTNHVHLLIEPKDSTDLGKFMQSVGRRYVRYINDSYGRSGTLWEGRFKSAVVSHDEYLIACSRYIELNPVRAGMVKHPGEYRWSSYGHRADGLPDRLLDFDPWYSGLAVTAVGRQTAYRQWMDASIHTWELDQIRENTQRGRMIGSEKFQREVENSLGRKIIGVMPGRPKKALPVDQK